MLRNEVLFLSCIAGGSVGAPPATGHVKESRCDVPPFQIASIDARLVTRSFLLPSLDICKKASTP
jgi:hypothetical protein